jgi:hypothetical protein|tara:strand:- start:889 stop:1128 length:240 start_codon:yes stop_codon:yes gene_type:complete
METNTLKTELEQDKFLKDDFKSCLFYQLEETNKKIINNEKFLLENLNTSNFEQMQNHINCEIMIYKQTKKFITNQLKTL